MAGQRAPPTDRPGPVAVRAASGFAPGKPLQFHVGFGDRDCDLHKTNPLYLLDFLRNSGDTPIMLLHCYPYEREAGYLAQAFNNVYLDGGLAINYLGARSASFIGRCWSWRRSARSCTRRTASVQPNCTTSGRGCGATEFGTLLQGFVDAGEWSERDAIRVVNLIAHDNARRVYALG